MKKTLRFNGWRVELDSSQVIPSDPGAGTPAMVYAPSGASGTYWCVCGTGEIDCGAEDVPHAVQRWLNSIGDAVDDFVAAHSSDPAAAWYDTSDELR